MSAFIIKLSELAPRLIIKQMTLLAKQLDSEVKLNAPVRNMTGELRKAFQGLYSTMCSNRGLREPHIRFEPAGRTQ